MNKELEATLAELQAVDHASIIAIGDFAVERLRQIKAEGFTLEHDDRHSDGELSAASSCYAACGGKRLNDFAQSVKLPPMLIWPWSSQWWIWPWSSQWWKPESPAKNRIKAAALLIADHARWYRSAP